ncbi:MAG: hypothetical protein F6K44_29105 [Moorea sp. SIO3E2]|nr:hypothetical protein [Moorena sp. SIO3E2]
MMLRVGARLQGREALLAPLGRTCRMGILPVRDLVERAECPLYCYPLLD